jgi:hypothetical protein
MKRGEGTESGDVEAIWTSFQVEADLVASKKMASQY